MNSPRLRPGSSCLNPALLALCAGVALLSACGSDGGGGACTEIGCTDQVLLQPRAPNGELVLKVVGHATVDGEKIDINCLTPSSGSVLCSDQGVTLIGVKASSFTVTFGSGDLYVSDHSVTPTYAAAQPNGAGCPPTCQQAVVDVALGGGLVDGVSPDGGGGSDTGSADAGTTDAGTTDAGTSDAGTSDAGTTDAGPDPDTTPGKDTSVPGGCCNASTPCQGTQVCAKGDVCKPTDELKSGECWTDAQCGAKQCLGAQICHCGGACFAPDKPGQCGEVVDAGSSDAGGSDAGSSDAGATDAGSNDAGPADTGSKPSCEKIDPNGYGLCDMVLGVGWDGSKCVNVSGCGCKTDCDKLFKTMAACKSACP